MLLIAGVAKVIGMQSYGAYLFHFGKLMMMSPSIILDPVTATPPMGDTRGSVRLYAHQQTQTGIVSVSTMSAKERPSFHYEDPPSLTFQSTSDDLQRDEVPGGGRQRESEKRELGYDVYTRHY